MLNEKPNLSYFDLSKDTKAVVDASPTALPEFLKKTTPNMNDETVVAYGIRAHVEQGQPDRARGLAVVFECEYFRLFL